MGVVVKATGFSLNSEIKSSIQHAVLAARACLEQSGEPMEDVGLLINVGIYRDDNTVEPAISALIQKELGLNLDYVKQASGRSALSFDLMNGSCGVLNAIQVAQAVLAAGDTQRVLIVSSDTGSRTECMGAAMLLGQGEGGFGPVYTRASREGSSGFQGYTELYQPHSRTQVTLVESEEEERIAADWIQSCIHEYATPDMAIMKATTLSAPIVELSQLEKKPALLIAVGSGLSMAWTTYA